MLNLQNPETAPMMENFSTHEKVPVIDLEDCSFEQNPDLLGHLSDKIGTACKEWGFFQVINHGISTSHMDLVWDSTRKFFSLPKQNKRALRRSSENPWGISTMS